MTALFCQETPLGHDAEFTFNDQHHIIHGENLKRGWELPSAFEVRDSVKDPIEVYQSSKDITSYYYVRFVGETGASGENKWYTVTFIDSMTGQVGTAYNTLRYAQKGTKVWPKP
jgi:hypothetical protein